MFKYSGLISEILFVFLPFVVMFLVRFLVDGENILFEREWAFAAAVLSGRAVVEFVKRGVSVGESGVEGATVLFVVLIIVFVLVPSLIVLALIFVLPVGSVGVFSLCIFGMALFAFIWSYYG